MNEARRVSALLPLMVASAAALGTVLAVPGPLAADWIVTRDGARIETKGKWRVEGAKVVFDLPNGTMGVLRKTEIDLDASAAASASAKPAPAASQPEKAPGQLRDPRAPREGKKPVLVLTDKDVSKGPPPDAPDPAQVTANPNPAATPDGTVVVVESWRQEMTQNGGIEVSGLLKNSGADVAGNITVEVEAVDDNGKIHTAAGFLDKNSLVRNARTSFRALFPDLTQLSKPPVFTVKADAATIGLKDEAKKPPADGKPAEGQQPE